MTIMLKPSSGRGQTFESLSASLQDAIKRIPPHEQNIPPAIDARKPAADFTDPAVFERSDLTVRRSML